MNTAHGRPQLRLTTGRTGPTAALPGFPGGGVRFFGNHFFINLNDPNTAHSESAARLGRASRPEGAHRITELKRLNSAASNP
jgi:hypothetical protein